MSLLAREIIGVVLAAGFAVGSFDIAYEWRGATAAKFMFVVGSLLAAIAMTGIVVLVVRGPV